MAHGESKPLVDEAEIQDYWRTGGRISGSSGCIFCRVTYHTAAVHVGNRSKPGISSAPSDGRNAQCHPRRGTRTNPTAKSSTESAGDAAPSANKGKPTI